MAYYFMMGVVPLPITPSSLTIKTPSMNKTLNLINEGEINIPKDQGLREISFEFLLPTVQKYPFATWQFGSYTATALIPLLNMWKKTKFYFPFIVVRMSPKGEFMYFTSIKCLIEDFEYKEDAEEYGLDTMCSITLKEYKHFGTKRVKIESKDGKNLADIENTRDVSSMIQESTILTSVMEVLGSISPFSRRNSNTKIIEKETIISASKRNGDDVLSVFDTNNIKIPASTSDDAWMAELGIQSPFNLTESTNATSGETMSLSDILLIGSGGMKYKSPSASKVRPKFNVPTVGKLV
jgi:hypothetical protein